MDKNDDIEKTHYENKKLWEINEIPLIEQLRIRETIAVIPADVASILDVGCGNGWFLHALKEKNKFSRLMGIDRSKTALQYVETEKLCGSIDQLPLLDKEFDMVSSLECLEHLPANIYKNALLELSRVAKKYILITVPNNENLSKNMFECPDCKGRFNVSWHYRSFNHNSVKRLFANQGFKCIYLEPLSVKDKTYLFEKKILNKIWRLKMEKQLAKLGTVCPMCHTPIGEVKKQVSQEVVLTHVYNYRRYIKALWPRKNTHRWVIALFVRM